MISGADELELANARANIVMKLDNTSTYESWLIVDSYLGQLEKENQELKEQLENNSKINVADHKYASTCEDKVIILETQQKEFIKYLEDEIKELQKIKETELDYDLIKDVITQLLDYEEILQKYKGINREDNE